jgi:hypothetical protein
MSKYQPALLGGLFIGVLSALPVIGAANVCCCLWGVAGGVLVAYLMQQAQPMPIETGAVALQGLLAGAIGGVIAAAGFALFAGLSSVAIQEEIRQGLERSGDLSPEMRDAILRWFTGPMVGLIILAISVPVYGVFSMLGSLLGVAFFRKKTPPQPPGPAIQG